MMQGIPHFEQWLGIWAMQEEQFLAGWSLLQGIDLHLHLASEKPAQAAARAQDQRSFGMKEGVAIIPLQGVLMKSVPSMMDGTSTVLARRQIRDAARDPDVSAILLHIDSPGGTVAGNQELVDDIAAAGKRKPTWSYIQDLGASAAYWAAIAAQKVFANGPAILGSIGTYGVAYDLSAKATLQGIKVHVLRAGEMKGAGEPGVELSASYLAERQRIVNELNEFFIRGVSHSRRMTLSKVRELADGRVHIGQAAVERNLIDGIQSLDVTFSQLLAVGKRSRTQMLTNLEPEGVQVDIAQAAQALTQQNTAGAGGAGAQPANGPPTQPASAAARPATSHPATYHELKAALPGVDATFLTSQLEANATVGQAQSAYMAKLAADNQQLRTQVQQQPAAPATPPRKPGVAPVSNLPPERGTSQGDAVEAFNDAVNEEMTRSKVEKHVAHATVCRKRPELREAMLAAHNAEHAQAARRR